MGTRRSRSTSPQARYVGQGGLNSSSQTPGHQTNHMHIADTSQKASSPFEKRFSNESISQTAAATLSCSSPVVKASHCVCWTGVFRSSLQSSLAVSGRSEGKKVMGHFCFPNKVASSCSVQSAPSAKAPHVAVADRPNQRQWRQRWRSSEYSPHFLTAHTHAEIHSPTALILEIYPDNNITGPSVQAHQGVLVASCEYLINGMAAAMAEAAGVQQVVRQPPFMVAEVPYDVMTVFLKWLYAAHFGSNNHQFQFQTMADILSVWRWTKHPLYNTGFRDSLVIEMVKLVQTITNVRPNMAAHELVHVIANTNSDIDGGMAHFFADYILHSELDDAGLNQASNILASGSPHTTLCHAFMHAVLTGKKATRSGRPQKQLPQVCVTDPCKYHEHPVRQPCSSSLTSPSQDCDEPMPPAREQMDVEPEPVRKEPTPGAHAAPLIEKMKNKKQWKYNDAEILKYIKSPKEDFTKMHGHGRTMMRDKIRHRMREFNTEDTSKRKMADAIVVRTKGLVDGKGRIIKHGGDGQNRHIDSQPGEVNADSDNESIAVAGVPRQGVATRSSKSRRALD